MLVKTKVMLIFEKYCISGWGCQKEEYVNITYSSFWQFYSSSCDGTTIINFSFNFTGHNFFVYIYIISPLFIIFIQHGCTLQIEREAQTGNKINIQTSIRLVLRDIPSVIYGQLFKNVLKIIKLILSSYYFYLALQFYSQCD